MHDKEASDRYQSRKKIDGWYLLNELYVAIGKTFKSLRVIFPAACGVSSALAEAKKITAILIPRHSGRGSSLLQGCLVVSPVGPQDYPNL